MAANPDKIDAARHLLTSCTFVGSLPDEAVSQLIRTGHLRRYRRGAPLFERGDPGDSLFLIVSGKVKISNVTVDGREVVLSFLGPGDVNGEIAALDGGPRTSAAAALEDTEVFQIMRRDLLPVLLQNPEALMEIVVLLCEKLRATSDIVEDRMRNMQGRFAAGLLRLARQHGRRTSRGIEIDLTVNQRDLGNYLGLSRENTSRHVTTLAKQGLLRMQDGILVVVDEKALAALASAEGD